MVKYTLPRAPGSDLESGTKMPELAVLTPSYRRDAELFEDLHASVLAHTAPDVVHHVVCPPSDLHLFRRYVGPRCRVWTHRDFLPRRYVPIANASGLAINLRRPWPPVRGWVVQQLMKMAAAAQIDATALLIADSDAVLVRHVRASDLTVDGRTAYCRVDGAVTAQMGRHVQWHKVARRLLQLPEAAELPLPDYVSAMSVWDSAVLIELKSRLEQVSGRNWLEMVASELHVSEFMLYGVFVDEVLRDRAALQTPLCQEGYAKPSLKK